MTLALLSTVQHVSDVNTSIFRSLLLLVALCRLTWGVLVLCSGIVCWWCGIRVQAEPPGSACTRIPHHQQTNQVVQPVLGYHSTNRQSRYTPQVSQHNATSSRKLLKMDVLTSETCWAVDNKASVIKLVNLYSSNVYLAVILLLSQWCTVQHTSHESNSRFSQFCRRTLQMRSLRKCDGQWV